MKKTLPVLLRTLPLLFLLYSAGVLQAQVFSVSELRCEQSQRRLAVDPAGPRLSWQLNADRRGCLPKRLSHSRGRFAVALADDNGNVWDSGKVFSDRSVLVPYGGSGFTTRQSVLLESAGMGCRRESLAVEPARLVRNRINEHAGLERGEMDRDGAGRRFAQVHRRQYRQMERRRSGF